MIRFIFTSLLLSFLLPNLLFSQIDYIDRGDLLTKVNTFRTAKQTPIPRLTWNANYAETLQSILYQLTLARKDSCKMANQAYLENRFKELINREKRVTLFLYYGMHSTYNIADELINSIPEIRNVSNRFITVVRRDKYFIVALGSTNLAEKSGFRADGELSFGGINCDCFLKDFDKQKALDLTNAIRIQGCYCSDTTAARLLWDDELANAAQIQANDMCQHNFTGHKGTDGSNSMQRVKRISKTEWEMIGENAGQAETIEGVTTGWKMSTGHCHNIMEQRFTHIGIARSNNKWVQVFGKKS